jgi:hypothetical protein
MRKRRALLLLIVLLALYPVSYIVVSRNGYYDPGPLGLSQGPDDTITFCSKFGYRWHPFDGLCQPGNFSGAPDKALLSTFYYPLLLLDRKWWHTEGRSETGRFPVRHGMAGSTWSSPTTKAGH